MLCQPGSQAACYEGPPMTDGVGNCHAGTMTCTPDGMAYGPCDGQVVPEPAENCQTPFFDENCDGGANEGCPPEQVAILAALPPGYAEDIRNQLLLTGAFMTVNILDVSAGTPTLMDLQPFQSALVVTDKVLSNPVVLGDVLADYYDGGGRVVLALHSTVGVGTRVEGKFGDPAGEYAITDPAGGLDMPLDDGFGMAIEPQNPLMKAVTSFSYVMSRKSTGKPINTGIIVAQWLNGAPLVIRGTAKGRNRVDVNLYPLQVQNGMSVWMGDVGVILRNALLY